MGPYELLEKVVKVFERLQISYLVTGSVAAMAYGEPRLTFDYISTWSNQLGVNNIWEAVKKRFLEKP